MISPVYKEMLNTKSVIREFAEFAAQRGADIGYENVFDFSLGNPSVPPPPEFNRVMAKLLSVQDPQSLHGYSPTLGNNHYKKAVAQSLNARFGMDYKPEHIFPSSGAAGALAHAIRCVAGEGDEIITFAPFFPEYRPYVNFTGAKLVVVPASPKDFQIDFEAFEKLLSTKTAAVLINTPNNPSGIAYSEETLRKLSDMLSAKQEIYAHDIFLISDEPYREIVFDGKTAPYVSSFYENTLSCYSFSKSLSLPGERIGYLAVNPKCREADKIPLLCGQISRTTGHNCPASIIQLAVSEVIDLTSDMSVYERNMNLLYDKLVDLGFTVVRPGGTFYIFPKALEEDAGAFCKKALNYDLILVPGDSFGCPGYFRMAYCIDTEKVEQALNALEKFVATEYPR